VAQGALVVTPVTPVALETQETPAIMVPLVPQAMAVQQETPVV
jgi:hypothetical protein